jgi:hypothetical protein
MKKPIIFKDYTGQRIRVDSIAAYDKDTYNSRILITLRDGTKTKLAGRNSGELNKLIGLLDAEFEVVEVKDET